MSNEFSITDNHDGTITKTMDGKNYVYNILVGKNIPDDESIIDYRYSQFDDKLQEKLSENQIPTDQFCSGTCVAMILAISRGDKNIKPTDVVLWDNSKDENGKSEINWDGGLKDWEQEKDVDNDGGQIYDNRQKDEETGIWHFKSVEGNIENAEDYLKEIKFNLAAGQPVIIHVKGSNMPEHFVVAVGIEAGVSLEEATFEQLVIFDPGTDQKYQIATIGNSYKDYEMKDERILTPYLYYLDTNQYVYDENAKKTTDPYYIDPITKNDGSIVPAETGKIIKKIIASITGTSLPDSEKERIAAQMVKVFTGESDFVFENKTILENGEYTPGDNIRWDRVTVNVPQNAPDIMKKIDGLPVHASLSLENGFRIDFSVDLEDTVPVQEAAIDWASWTPTGGGSRTYYPSWKQTFLMVFAKFYKDGELMFAMYSRTAGAEYNKQLGYYAYEGKPPYISSRVFISDISGMTATPVMFNGYSSGNIELHFNYKKNWEVYSDGVYSRTDVNDKSDSVYFNNVSRSHQLISDLDLAGKTKALIELQVAFARTMGYNNINFDISNA